MKHALTAITLLLALLLLIAFPEIASASVIQAMKLCASSIAPHLFPFLIVTNLWLHSGYAKIISNRLNLPVRKMFHLPGDASPALLFGFLSGFPVGAKTAVALYTSGHLQKKETEQVLLFCNNAGPAFILGVIGNGIFHSRYIGAILWFIHIISAIIIGILFRGKDIDIPSHKAKMNRHISFHSSALTQSILDAGNTIFQICIYVAAFSIISGFLTAMLPTSFTASSCYPLLSGILEISGAISLLKVLTPKTAFILSSVLLGWSGCCIHFQVMALTSGTGLQLNKYFGGKILHAAISLLLSYTVAPLLFH